ncbi:MAG: hypothetical protein PF447_08575 [Spirochaetaceae bacterium]|jgi:hypothetical protein|nr:hypothetical protein [Spirochaetaceae bacterium]
MTIYTLIAIITTLIILVAAIITKHAKIPLIITLTVLAGLVIYASITGQLRGNKQFFTVNYGSGTMMGTEEDSFKYHELSFQLPEDPLQQKVFDTQLLELLGENDPYYYWGESWYQLSELKTREELQQSLDLGLTWPQVNVFPRGDCNIFMLREKGVTANPEDISISMNLYFYDFRINGPRGLEDEDKELKDLAKPIQELINDVFDISYRKAYP